MTLTLYQAHTLKWQDGCGASICPRAKRVFARGSLPCDILFIGEAPGLSEDTSGIPFCGPAGKLLDIIIDRAIPQGEFRLAFTNIVCCLPRNETGLKDKPDALAIDACKPRLLEFIDLAKPKMIVAVGAIARDNLKPGYLHSLLPRNSVPLIAIKHPAAILQANIVQRNFEILKQTAILESAIDSHLKQEESE